MDAFLFKPDRYRVSKVYDGQLCESTNHGLPGPVSLDIISF